MEGRKHLGAIIRVDSFKEEFVIIEMWVDEIAKINCQSSLPIVYCFANRFRNKFTYLETIPEMIYFIFFYRRPKQLRG